MKPLAFAVAFSLTAFAAVPATVSGQGVTPAPVNASSQPPANAGFFPLSEVHRGLKATAWTVFEGTQPEPMGVEILGVLRGARGPGQDMILARLQGTKPEYTGVVEGMSGSPVYVGDKLLGSLSYRIGQFSKDPIAGITPIEQMLGLRDLPTGPAQPAPATATPVAQSSTRPDTANMNFQAMDTPLVMSGFAPAAIKLWQEKMAGTSLAMVAAGGMGSGESAPDTTMSASAASLLKAGSAISAQLVRGDMEMAATCTITYIDPKQLLACGHPVLQAGPVSLPMTTTEVLATLSSPLNSFKIINTGKTVGAFTEDRQSGIRGILGAKANMIPMHIAIDGPGGLRKINVEVLDLPSLTTQAVLVVLYNSLLQSNEATAESSYHITGTIDLDNYAPAPLDLWATAGGMMPAPMQAALLTGEHFSQLYSNDARRGAVKNINLKVQMLPQRLEVDLVSARLISSDIVRAGDTIVVEATIRPFQQAERNVRIPIKLPTRLNAGNVRVLVSDSATLDRTLNQPQPMAKPANVEAVMAQARREHSASRIYVSLLAPEAQASMEGNTLTTLPLSMANALESIRTAKDIGLNGESAEVAGDAPADGVLSGYQILTVHIQPGGGLN